MSTLVGKTLLIDVPMQKSEERLNALQLNNPKCFETLKGICSRLSLIDQIRSLSFTGSILLEKENFLYQVDRLSAYLAVTCIDVLTGERYQPYNQWLEKSYKNGTLGDTWNQAITDLFQAQTSEKIASEFVKWTNILYKNDYNEMTSIRKAFMYFVTMSDSWLKHWILQNYIVEEFNSNFELKKSWQALSDEEKCRNIAYYLYSLRNLYTHTVTDFQAMEFVQRSNSNLPDKYRVKGFFAIFFPPTSNDEPFRRISLPEDKRESDMIRLLVITWIRKHWLDITTDNESFIQEFWDYRMK